MVYLVEGFGRERLDHIGSVVVKIDYRPGTTRALQAKVDSLEERLR